MLAHLLPPFAIALVGMACALIMGFAIQRGATCTVIAVGEMLEKRRATRLRSMLEASIWVLGGLLAAHAWHLLGATPPGFSLTLFTVIGAALLGVGAYVNQACVFGAIARFGCGEWSFLLTPLGYYVGCCAFRLLFSMPPNVQLMESSVLFRYSSPIGGFVLLWVVYRLINYFVDGKRWGSKDDKSTIGERIKQALTQHVWAPGAATIVIGITFLCMFVLIGPWTYTDLLADLSFNMANNLTFRSLLLLALLGGAILGGWTAGRLRGGAIQFAQCLRCLAGGAMMGFGSLMIPGGNDGLLLIGLPLLWPYAWIAFLTMCVSIAVCMHAQKLIGKRSAQ